MGRIVAKPWDVEKMGYGNKPLVLSIDMQKLFTQEDSPFGGGTGKMPGFNLIRRAIIGEKKLMDRARAANIQIAHTKIGFRKDGKDLGLWKITNLAGLATLDSKWMEMCPELEPKEEDIVFIRKSL